MTKAEKNHLDRTLALGCVVCRQVFEVLSPAEAHHVRRLATSKKREDAPVIPLCPAHHRGPYGIGIHSGRETWEKAFGSELAMVAEVAATLPPAPKATAD